MHATSVDSRVKTWGGCSHRLTVFCVHVSFMTKTWINSHRLTFSSYLIEATKTRHFRFITVELAYPFVACMTAWSLLCMNKQLTKSRRRFVLFLPFNRRRNSPFKQKRECEKNESKLSTYNYIFILLMIINYYIWNIGRN